MLPDVDPVAVYRKVFGVTVIDGGGGTFTWNKDWQTFESSAYGAPADQKIGPTIVDSIYGLGGNFGVSFENSGLRGRAEIDLPPVK